MGLLVGDCPRCDAVSITFDIRQAILTQVHYDWQRHYEAFCVCRNCHRSTVFKLSQRDIHSANLFKTENPLVSYDKSLTNLVNIEGYISSKDAAARVPPEFVPEDIQRMFSEGATCLATGCWNAAGAMFRGCVDLATRPLIPAEGTLGIKRRERYNLGPRLEWLFAHSKLPAGFVELSTSIREDGNDAAHEGTLTEDDAEDLFDFTYALLERLYTEPARLERANTRRTARRSAA